MHKGGQAEGTQCQDTPFPIFHRILEALRIEYWYSTSHFVSTPERRNKNINLNKYFISSNGDRTHNQSILQTHFVPLRHDGPRRMVYIILNKYLRYLVLLHKPECLQNIIFIFLQFVTHGYNHAIATAAVVVSIPIRGNYIFIFPHYRTAAKYGVSFRHSTCNALKN